MGQRELAGRGAQVDRVPGRRLFQTPHLGDDLRRRLHVVVARPVGAALRAGGQDAAVVGPAGDDADVLLQAQRQQLVQRALLQDRVAAGQQEAVEVAGARQAHQHLALIHAGADRADHALRAEPVQHRVGAVHHFREVLVRIMDVHDVQAVDAQPRQAVLQRALDPVGAVVVVALDHPGARAVPGLGESAGARHVLEPPADLGRQHVAVARHAAQRGADPPLAGAGAIERGGIQEVDARLQRRAHDLVRLLVGNVAVDAADRRASQAHPGDLQLRRSKPYALQRVHAFLLPVRAHWYP